MSSTRSSSPDFVTSRDESISSKAPLMSDLESQRTEPSTQKRQKCLKLSIISLVCLALACLGGSFAYANTSCVQESTAVEHSHDYGQIAEDQSNNFEEDQLTRHTNNYPTIMEEMIGRWQEKSKSNVPEYIDAEEGPYFYQIFAKKMKADIEYEMVAKNVFRTTFYVSWMPPLKYPLRLDMPYEHENPTGDAVVSEARFRVEFNDIFVVTKGGHEGTTTTRIQIVNEDLILTSTMLEKNVSCERVYTRKTTE